MEPNVSLTQFPSEFFVLLPTCHVPVQGSPTVPAHSFAWAEAGARRDRATIAGISFLTLLTSLRRRPRPLEPAHLGGPADDHHLVEAAVGVACDDAHDVVGSVGGRVRAADDLT